MENDKELYKRIKREVDARLSGRRLEHVYSVAKCAKKLARAYGVCEFDAKVAGLLHDWDKLLTDDELPARMDEFGLEYPDHMELLMPVLHSFTGAEAVHQKFPELSDEIITAIRRHTLGAVTMSDLDMVIFVADIIEPKRRAYKGGGIEDLRKKAGKIALEELYFAAYAQTMRSLIERRRYIHPDAVEIWNGLVATCHPVNTAKRQGDPNVVL